MSLADWLLSLRLYSERIDSEFADGLNSAQAARIGLSRGAARLILELDSAMLGPKGSRG